MVAQARRSWASGEAVGSCCCCGNGEHRHARTSVLIGAPAVIRTATKLLETRAPRRRLLLSDDEPPVDCDLHGLEGYPQNYLLAQSNFTVMHDGWAKAVPLTGKARKLLKLSSKVRKTHGIRRAAEESSPRAPRFFPAGLKDMANATLLVVDDERLVRWSLRERFAARATRRRGRDRRRSAGAGRPGVDLVLLDYRLPDGDGLTRAPADQGTGARTRRSF